MLHAPQRVAGHDVLYIYSVIERISNGRALHKGIWPSQSKEKEPERERERNEHRSFLIK